VPYTVKARYNNLGIPQLTLLYSIYEGPIVAMAGSKIDISKFYYCEKSVNLHSCSTKCCQYHRNVQESNLNNDIKTGLRNTDIFIVTYANFVG
jgi:hypothetical protein